MPDSNHSDRRKPEFTATAITELLRRIKECRKALEVNGPFLREGETVNGFTRDYGREETRKWEALRLELEPGLAADDAEFAPLDVERMISKVKQRKREAHESGRGAGEDD